MTVSDLQEVDLPLEAGDLGSEPREAFLKGAVPLAEPIDREAILLVEAVELVGFLREALPLPEEGAEEFFLLGDGFAPLGELGGDGLRARG